jgi:uncharacterized protein Yka (UPF0111/DUF47 family)
MATIPSVSVVPFPSIDHALDLCARHARYVAEAAAVLRVALGRLNGLDAEVSRLTEIERQADALVEQVLALVPRVTTLLSERAAVVTLTHALDDVLDDVDAALTRMLLFRLTSASSLAAALVAVLIRQAEALEQALELLRTRGRRPAIREHLAVARGLAAEGEGLVVQGLARLQGDELDLAGVVEWLKWSEVHRPLGGAIRRGRTAADAIEALTGRLV